MAVVERQKYSLAGTSGVGLAPIDLVVHGRLLSSLAFTSLTMPTAEEAPTWDADFLVVLGSVLLFLAGPITLIGAYFWWPRFMLPGRIQERLRAGDPVKTAYPLPEVQHLMTKPQNQLPPWLAEPGVRVVPGPRGRLTYADHLGRWRGSQ